MKKHHIREKVPTLSSREGEGRKRGRRLHRTAGRS